MLFKVKTAKPETHQHFQSVKMRFYCAALHRLKDFTDVNCQGCF